MAIPLLIIVGPTASGKSKLSVELAKFYDGEIISADSMQVYKYMDIGTAKITDEEKQGIPHYMIDIVEPNVKFSVAEFEKMAKPIIDDIYKRGRLPIVVGGTGLYIDSLIYIMNFSDYIGNDDFRSALKNIAEVLGNDYLFNRLKVVDPKMFDKLHPNDLRRIIRALEVYQFTGKPISVYQELSSKRMNPEYDVIMIGLNFRDRNKLYKRIDDRVDIMLKNNLVNEVVNLLKIGYNKYDTSMQALGYKEIAEYLDGNVTFDEAISNLKKRTRRYAKRQITWFKSYKIINWFYVDDYIDFEELKKNIICFLAGKLNFK
ncbi:tRNA (adenosine(37)-N6)-dimethylallyltransferase MiaA [Thermoanaerobacterium thermosaccharolyticum]|uniref:tRNA (adenosine(37)-N6)-dimethylallyltransferase MiaA n=1 Tax=Thermoanaerobacterium thermosaccharolyticum TaxID=1517 RepID=UPI000C08CA69|nr:tRNA (adenosine(37)-N6)-dimethylallyltransferase MiaA [Thermoanaerobacterium thermosaccharolyticum]PHO07687.1 tRNA (adenosine(37)-N6)-dimethylallyltransferase MiaA [Thermoanaerobacterium thermosaccharolyticum]